MISDWIESESNWTEINSFFLSLKCLKVTFGVNWCCSMYIICTEIRLSCPFHLLLSYKPSNAPHLVSFLSPPIFSTCSRWSLNISPPPLRGLRCPSHHRSTATAWTLMSFPPSVHRHCVDSDVLPTIGPLPLRRLRCPSHQRSTATAWDGRDGRGEFSGFERMEEGRQEDGKEVSIPKEIFQRMDRL